MSCYPTGKELKCPLQHPGCAGVVKNRGARSCYPCSNRERYGSKTGGGQPAVGQKAVKDSPSIQDSLRASGDSAEVTRVSAERVQSLADLIRVCDIDTSIWEVERYVCNKWDMGSVPRRTGNDTDGWARQSTEPQATPLFQIKAWLKRKVNVIAARDEIASLIADAEKRLAEIPRRSTAKPARMSPKLDSMLEIAIPDLHVGKLAWSVETGHGNYDVKIALQRFETAMDTLITRTAGHGYAQVLFVIGNDILNSDNIANTTTRGTQQSTDGRYYKTFGIVRDMLARAIEERLLPLAPEVVIAMVPGNHDTHSAWHLGDSLRLWFRVGYPTIRVDSAPTKRKYHEFGKVMLMLTHGDTGKHADYPALMATEQPEMFGRTVHREAHIGHRHEQRLIEVHGVCVRTSPALCEPDSWHADMTFVGNAMAAEAIVWHREEGRIATAMHSVPRGQS